MIIAKTMIMTRLVPNLEQLSNQSSHDTVLYFVALPHEIYVGDPGYAT